ncbi:4'-phosphopantetheinyl transferase family protein [Leptolyngbya sp. NIES-2104]|uniref:4'-phosphopantetheinyl transferase family protein n=1 Tax=Leptolyngbya sp. NIES-2104 TaxID=1552121 RepID=UPI0006EC97F4|nr:4'-phosphopantetheinyl transferase superfamily protein [Leptolyngbya sp. NIES-2104]GAP98708.1 4'-phosphopantetheinyl transferase [Leptolyngbya sp. NIES-2104]
MIWQKPPEHLNLGQFDVHIWQVNLDAIASLHGHAIAVSEDWLSSDERSRADRFKFEHLKQRFIAGRGFLRSLLARYLHTNPEALEFQYASHGKPFLKDSAIQFNLAHSEHLALYAVTLDRAVGIDIEHRRTVDQLEKLVQRFFRPSEARTIEAEPELFFEYWTCKEAFLKATGTGLSKLQELEIDRTRLKTIPREARSQQWHLEKVPINDQFVSAIVVEKNCSKLELSYFLEQSE